MFDNPIFFLILLSLLATAAEWIGKRRKSRQADAAAEEENNAEETSSPRRRNFREKQQEWEERLRRLLEGEVEPPPSESKPPPQPVAPPKTPLKNQTPPPVKEIPVRPSFQPATRSATVFQKIPSASGKDPKIRRTLQRLPIPLSQRFRNRQALRQAIIASVVFGPSKGTEENSDLLRF